MNEHCIKNLRNQIIESPGPLPERKNPHMPWELEPDTEVPIIPEDPGDVSDGEETPIISMMEVIE
ncbi:MAG: hypothetical protein M1496_04470 [Candidatus Thermoplasmatota archaeon]|nr:hypothetical protein [Candidatus Thermoplasmatota archaeon]